MQRDSTSSIGCKETFLTIGAALGFIVDSIALVALMSNLNFSATSPTLPQVPKMSFGSFSLEWKDVTLVILIYVAVVFTLIAMRILRGAGLPTQIQFTSSALLTHLCLGLLLCWLAVFVPFASFSTYLGIAESWLFGLLLLLAWRVFNERTLSVLFGTLAFTVPTCTLLEAGFNHSGFGSALLSAFGWNFAGLVGFGVVWLLSVLATWLMSDIV